MPGAAVTKIRLPYIKEYTDRTGVARRYFRRKGRTFGALPGNPGSPEFMEAYQAFLAAEPKAQSTKAPGTIGALVTSYYASPDYRNLSTNSQTLYSKSVLEPFVAKHGHRLVRDILRDKIVAYVQDIGLDRPGLANLTRSVLLLLMAYAVAHGQRRDNPLAGLKPYKVGTHHTWTDDELKAYEARWPLGTRQRLAYATLLYTGQRVGDARNIRLRDALSGAIPFTQQKTGVELMIEVHPELRRAIKAGPIKGVYLLGDPNGAQMKDGAIWRLISKAVRDASLPDNCVPHGLRKALMRRLAESGATGKEIQAVSGHKTLKEVERYTAAADQRKMGKAALATLKPLKGRTPRV